VGASGRIRLFCGLRLPDGVAAQLAAWQAEHLHGGRIVVPANLHVTLAFLGHRPADELPAIAGELGAAAGKAGPIELEPEGYRETRSVGMVVLRDAGGAGAALADDLGERLERIGAYRREQRPWLPHVTVLRFRERPRLDPPAPSLGPFSPSDAAVYSSVLRSHGAQYEILESVALGGR
jgi:RNA 2',3'-cyclic 3'-phosphodiesterase